MSKVYAAYAQPAQGDAWRLAAVSVLSAERARALAEREQRRPDSMVKSTVLLVREYESMLAVPWRLEAGG
jgi:hypothetical protein